MAEDKSQKLTAAPNLTPKQYEMLETLAQLCASGKDMPRRQFAALGRPPEPEAVEIIAAFGKIQRGLALAVCDFVIE